MTTMSVPRRLARRWPTALGLAAVAGCAVLVLRLSADVELAAGVATMMGVYPAAYAVGKPVAAWPAFGVLALLALGFFALGVNVGLAMTAVLVLLWLCALARGLARDGRWFGIETTGVFAFGAVTVAALAVDPRLGGVLAGVGWLAHGFWDAYHYVHDRVVNRPWSEMCAVVDIPVGLMLIVVSLLR